MANRKVTMPKIKEMLRLRFEVGLSNREIARSLSVSHSTVSDLLGRFQVAGMAWRLPEDVDEAALEAALYLGNTGKNRRRPEPDWNQVHRELRRKGVTLQLLWFEYKDRHPDGYQYSQFCERCRFWSGKLDLVLSLPRYGCRLNANLRLRGRWVTRIARGNPARHT